MSSVTLVHPAKAAGRNEMSFGVDTLVVPSNIVLNRGPIPLPEGEIWGSENPVRSDAVYTLALVHSSKVSLRHGNRQAYLTSYRRWYVTALLRRVKLAPLGGFFVAALCDTGHRRPLASCQVAKLQAFQDVAAVFQHRKWILICSHMGNLKTTVNCETAIGVLFYIISHTRNTHYLNVVHIVSVTFIRTKLPNILYWSEGNWGLSAVFFGEGGRPVKTLDQTWARPRQGAAESVFSYKSIWVYLRLRRYKIVHFGAIQRAMNQWDHLNI